MLLAIADIFWDISPLISYLHESCNRLQGTHKSISLYYALINALIFTGDCRPALMSHKVKLNNYHILKVLKDMMYVFAAYLCDWWQVPFNKICTKSFNFLTVTRYYIDGGIPE